IITGLLSTIYSARIADIWLETYYGTNYTYRSHSLKPTEMIFNVMGLVGIIKSITCLIFTYAIHMTFATIFMIIDSFTNKYESIVAVVYLMVTVLSYLLFRATRKRRHVDRNVGIMDTMGPAPQIGQGVMSYNNNDHVHAKGYPSIYPTIPTHDIFSIDGHTVPSAPPLPTHMQFNNFSNI
ncbi:unnamed protein product, partial [Oppiella nova]